MYKSVFALFKLYPDANGFDQLSIFDKAYQLQLISHIYSQQKCTNLAELEELQLPKLKNFEQDA